MVSISRLPLAILSSLLCLAVSLAVPLSVSAQQSTTPPPTPNLERWRAYHDRLVSTAKTLPVGASLAELLRPMLSLADTRAADSIAADENRTALVTVTLYVNGWPIAGLVPEARDWPRAERRSISLRGRGDLAQHFTVSAVVAAMAGAPIANAIGLYKELDDARRGSGFSFSDLAADRAGTVFGRIASESAVSARRLQQRVGAGLKEADIMPVVTGLPDNLPEAEFTRRYGGVNTPAYNKLVSEIEDRVAALGILR